MKPKLLLRIAAAIIFLHALAHTMGVYTWKNTNSHVPQDLIKQMTEQKFAFMGTTATMAAFYDGFGYASTIAMLLIVAILWILGSAPKKNAALSVKILWPAAAFLFLLGIDEIIYFFPMAAIFSFLAFLLTAFSIFKLSRSKSE